MSRSNYRYFHFSREQMKERKDTYDKLNKDWIPGTVVYNGSVVEYTMMSEYKVLPRYSDAKLVAEGNMNEMQYTEPTTKQKGMTV